MAAPDGTTPSEGSDPSTVPVGGTPGEPPAAAPARSGSHLKVLVGLTVTVFVLVAIGAFAGLRVLQADVADARREAALETARQVVHNLITIDYRTADRDVRRLLDDSTEQFADQFGLRGPGFVGTVTESQLVSTGQVSSAGVERVDGDSARVLVAVHATVRDRTLPQGAPRNYRLGVDLVWRSDRWLVSKVEFML